jgi:hypothetical protein
MSKTILVAVLVAALSACASSTRQAAVQLPGEPARSGLQVPPDVNERPVQVAAAPAR